MCFSAKVHFNAINNHDYVILYVKDCGCTHAFIVAKSSRLMDIRQLLVGIGGTRRYKKENVFLSVSAKWDRGVM